MTSIDTIDSIEIDAPANDIFNTVINYPDFETWFPLIQCRQVDTASSGSADIGSIAEGKLADLAIIDGNVLEDIRLSEYVSHTMLNGRLFDTTTMNEMLTGEGSTEPLFFHQAGGQQLPAGTLEALEAKQARHHWRH